MTVATESTDPQIGGLIACLTYFSYFLILVVGHIRDFLGKVSGWSRYEYGKTSVGYSVLLKSWESFYTRRLFHRIQGKLNLTNMFCLPIELTGPGGLL